MVHKGKKFAWVFTLLFCLHSFGATTRVGNGDDGSDLEGSTLLTDGPIVQARQTAVERLRSLNVSGIAGLGNLIPEVANTKLYLTKKNSPARLDSDKGHFHQDVRGFVYARTFARPHAATRFFPVAQNLDLDQLVSLHIHEGLHRALPSSINQDESIVAKITLAITAPDATHDGVRETVERVVPGVRIAGNVAHRTEKTPYPSTIGYEYRHYLSQSTPSSFKVERMHRLHSHLYPFGGLLFPVEFGMGLGLSFLEGPTAHRGGPLTLSAHLQVWSPQNYVIGIWGEASLNTLSADEIKNSPFGRDVYSLGILFSKETSVTYLENTLSVSFGGKSTQRVGNIDYQYDYGNVINARVKAGFKVGNLRLGGFGEFNLADHLKVDGGPFQLNMGRYRLFSLGPEFALTNSAFSISVYLQRLIASSNGANFNSLGNVAGAGASKGTVGVSFKLYF